MRLLEMKLSIGIAMLKMITRPTVGNGLLWSLGVHTVTGVATFAWCMWLMWSEPAWLSHERQVVQLQMRFSQPQPTEPTVVLETVFEPVTESPPDAVAPQVMELARRKQEVRLPERLQAKPEDPMVSRARASRRPLNERPVPVEQHVELRQQRREPPPPVVAVQIPGAEQKRADMSGNVPPSYPPVAIRNGYEGTVLLRLHVTATGDVEQVEVIRSSGHVVLDQAARQAVSTWRGQPATFLGQPTTSIETLPVRFRL